MRFADEGLSPEEHAQLLEGLTEMPEQSLLPFLLPVSLPSGLLKAKPDSAEVVYILGTSAPACQLVKPAIFDACEIISTGRGIGAAGHLVLAQHAPHLNRFLLSHLAGGRRQAVAVRELLKGLLQVSALGKKTDFHTILLSSSQHGHRMVLDGAIS